MPSLSNPHEVVLSRDVLITLVKDRQEAERPQPIVGPRRVQNHLKSVAATCSQAASATNADPWQSPTNDPWQAYKPSDRDPRPSKRYDQLATQLKTDLAAQLQDQLSTPASAAAAGSSDVYGARIQQLEVGMTELQAHNKQFHSWFTATGQRLSAQDEQLQQLQGQLGQQQQDLLAVRTEVHTSADNLHQAMQVSFSNMKNELSTDISTTLAAQMDRLETMISAKKTRHE